MAQIPRLLWDDPTRLSQLDSLERLMRMWEKDEEMKKAERTRKNSPKSLPAEVAKLPLKPILPEFLTAKLSDSFPGFRIDLDLSLLSPVTACCARWYLEQRHSLPPSQCRLVTPLRSESLRPALSIQQRSQLNDKLLSSLRGRADGTRTVSLKLPSLGVNKVR